MKIKRLLLIALVIITSSINLYAQDKNQDAETKELLQGLTKATNAELATLPITLDGKTFPIYDKDLKKLKGAEIYKALGERFVPEFYLNKDKEIALALLRKATAQEIELLRKAEANMSRKNKLIEKQAPDFSVTDIHGNKLALEGLKGKIVVLNFWFVQCKPCIIEIPELNELADSYDDVVFIAFSTSTRKEIDRFLKQRDFQYQIITDSKSIVKEYDVTAFPTHFVIDKTGKIKYVNSGYNKSAISEIENAIKKVQDKKE